MSYTRKKYVEEITDFEQMIFFNKLQTKGKLSLKLKRKATENILLLVIEISVRI